MPKLMLEPVDCSRGAPMGREPHGMEHFAATFDCTLIAVYLNRGGYDSGGAYWGNSINTLYCARSVTPGIECRMFVRARTKEQAKQQVREVWANARVR